MKTYERVALVYGASLVGSALYHYFKGDRGEELINHSMVSTVVVGSGMNVVLWLHDQSVVYSNPAQSGSIQINSISPIDSGKDPCPGLGNTPSKAIDLLNKINPQLLFRAADIAGVRISPETYENPAAVGMF
jgi:hypothetical protein